MLILMSFAKLETISHIFATPLLFDDNIIAQFLRRVRNALRGLFVQRHKALPRNEQPLTPIIVAIACVSFTATAWGAELQESCVRPPATVVEITGVNSTHARARAKFTEPDIVKACREGYVNQRSDWSPEECISQTEFEILGHEIIAEANCSQDTLRLGSYPLFRMPVREDCASGGIFAAPAFKMLCPHADDDIDRRIEAGAIWALYGRQATEAEISAALAWSRCTSRAVDLFSPQQEPAKTVAEAAIQSCVPEMGQYMAAFGTRYPESIKEAYTPELIARVMKNRAARQGAGFPANK